MARATITTPNLPELAALGGEDAILAHGCALLVKGGHANDNEGALLIDRLHPNDPDQPPVIEWAAPRIATSETHGTGCTLASAIAVGLAQAMPLSAAVARARDFVRLSLLNASGLGQGHGPMGQGGVRNEALLGGPVLNQITVPARDYAASLAFYRLLGLTLIVDAPENGYARFEAANGVTFSIHVADEHVEPGATTYLELAALDVWHAWLLRQGVRFEAPPRDQDWGWREAHLLDPAGNRLCLYQAGEYRRFPPWRVG
jgi:hydroxymethylpyrimidine/phosphomethylpyrimidine kinase